MKDIKLLVGALILFVVLLSTLLVIIINPNDINVVFMSDDRIIETVKIKKGSSIKKPIDPIKEEYNFVDWYYEDEVFDFNTKIKKNITLIAKWEPKNDKVQKFSVTFNTNGGSSIERTIVESGNTLDKPDDPTKEGYKFISWQLNNEDFDFNTKITEDITLTAKWGRTYIVSFNSNGGSYVDSQEVTEGSSPVKPINPTKAGYTFIEWQYDYVRYNFDSKVTRNITLNAKWQKDEPAEVTYTVTFNSDGGSYVSSQKVKSDYSATKPTDPTKEGYTFVEWQLNGDKYDFSSKITNNITLVAKWNKNENTNQENQNNENN